MITYSLPSKDFVSIEELLCFCKIYNKFEHFNKEINTLFIKSKEKYGTIIDKLYNYSKAISLNEKCIEHIPSRIKKFYKKNKEIVDIINDNYDIRHFINNNYHPDGELFNHGSIAYFYQYMEINNANAGRIFYLLEQIRNLGIKGVKFDTDIDFTKEEYSYNKADLFINNMNIEYLENMEAIPNYDENIVKYKTNGSNYKITINEINGFKGITVNNLLFSAKILPDNLNSYEVKLEIVSLKKKIEESCNIVKQVVDVNVGINSLYSQYELLKTSIDELDNFNKKEDILKSLSKIKKQLIKLNKYKEEFNSGIKDEFIEEINLNDLESYQKRLQNNNQ